MRYILFLILVAFSCQKIFSQKDIKQKKIKCCKKMPEKMDDIVKIDTLFILFQKSDDKKLIQSKSENIDNQEMQYSFLNTIVFPMQIFDYDNWTRVKIREPKIMYKKKSYICENMYRTIDVQFLSKFEMHFGLTFFEDTLFFIIELDSKEKGKYKLIQVNRPIYIQE